MALASVTREQFEIRSEVEVVHIPTGADFRAYPYSDLDDMLQSVKVSCVPRRSSRREISLDTAEGVSPRSWPAAEKLPRSTTWTSTRMSTGEVIYSWRSQIIFQNSIFHLYFIVVIYK